ncbi:CRAL/TRIO domain-containing protein, partial [Fragilariopsis cylindrus CCMP1102]
ICRWLRATKFNSEEILQRLQDNQYMFDEAKEYQFYGPDISKHMNNCPLSVFQSQYPFHPLGRGYNGCPIAYFLAGRINPEGILCLCSIDQLKHYFWYSFMYQMKIQMKESQKKNIDFCKCEGINVIDLKGLSISSLTHETMDVIKLSSKISDFFPETLHCMLIINAPSFFSFAWKIIKKLIDPRTASRIQLFSSSNEKASQQALEKLICKQTQLPKDYG